MKARLLAAAIGAATVLGGGNAFAADLGGNCCADLEERIAELEATTARKGNRKVSLTITGWVSSQLYWFDDGIESNLYVVDNNNDLSSNVKFTGSAQISPGWKAGYSLWIYTNGPSSLNSNEDWDGNPARGWGLNVENSYWFIQSDSLGKLSVGKQSLAADNAALGTDFSGTLFPANSVTFDGGALRVVENGVDTGGRWMNVAFWCEHAGVGIANDCAGARLNGVRYDTPTFAGFTLGASWGEDDYWDVALRYAGEFSGFKLAFATAYSESTDADITGTGANTNDNQYFQVGGMIKHLASGLWVHGTWGRNYIDDVPNNPPHPDATGWYLKAGWTTKFSALGNTHFYGEYGQNEDGFRNDQPCGSVFGDGCINGVQVVDSEATRYGAGIVQEIDAAAMSLWAKWRHHELDGVLDNGAAFAADDVDMFLAGAVIFY
ncbi:MAG: porin [Hyphomicrobium sp.]|nr:porin [Hyphomicrobium sp.]